MIKIKFTRCTLYKHKNMDFIFFNCCGRREQMAYLATKYDTIFLNTISMYTLPYFNIPMILNLHSIWYIYINE